MTTFRVISHLFDGRRNRAASGNSKRKSTLNGEKIDLSIIDEHITCVRRTVAIDNAIIPARHMLKYLLG